MDSDSSSEDSVAGGGLLSSLDIPPIFTELLELNKYEDGYMVRLWLIHVVRCFDEPTLIDRR